MAASDDLKLSASLEDYLEAIFCIVREKQAVRAKDISKRLDVARSSVTGALHALAERDMINYAPYDVITLTEEGAKVAAEVARRHDVLRDFLVKVLSVDQDQADETACHMEHAIPGDIIDRFVAFAEFVERCPRGGAKWIRGFGYFCDEQRRADGCEKCVEETLEEVRSKVNLDQNGTGDPMTLGAMQPGDRATIVRITGQGSIRRRLMDMGATGGSLVEVERVAPLGDPMEIKLKGYHLTLRREEAERITVEPV